MDIIYKFIFILNIIQFFVSGIYIYIYIMINIKIDDFEFKINGKFKWGTYDTISLSSNPINNRDDIFDFFVYRSNSEGGTLRLFLYDNQQGVLLKGEHYIVTTSLHNDLLKFINNCDINNSIPNLDDTSEYKNIFEKFFINTSKITDVTIKYMYEDVFVNKSRYISDPSNNNYKIFLPISFCKPGICFKEVTSIQDYITKIHECGKKNEYCKKLYEQYDILKTDDALKSVGSFSALVYGAISEYLHNYYSIDNNSITDYGEYNFNFENRFNIKSKYYQIIVKNKRDGSQLKILYMKYFYKNMSVSVSVLKEPIQKHQKIFDKEYVYIANIIPITSKITKYGIYDKIINPGSYIYKPFDYNSQIHIFENYNEEPAFGHQSIMRFVPKGKVGNTLYAYYFIGDINDGIFPFPTIYNSPLMKCLRDIINLFDLTIYTNTRKLIQDIIDIEKISYEFDNDNMLIINPEDLIKLIKKINILFKKIYFLKFVKIKDNYVKTQNIQKLEPLTEDDCIYYKNHATEINQHDFECSSLNTNIIPKENCGDSSGWRYGVQKFEKSNISSKFYYPSFMGEHFGYFNNSTLVQIYFEYLDICQVIDYKISVSSASDVIHTISGEKDPMITGFEFVGGYARKINDKRKYIKYIKYTHNI